MSEYQEYEEATEEVTEEKTEEVTDEMAEEVFQEQVEVISPKKKKAAGFLAIFLGWCGVDQFYLGKVGHGILSIGITLACVIAVIIAAIVAVVVSVLSLGILAIPAILVLALIAILAIAGEYVWPIVRAVKAFRGKAKDKNGALVID